MGCADLAGLDTLVGRVGFAWRIGPAVLSGLERHNGRGIIHLYSIIRTPAG